MSLKQKQNIFGAMLSTILVNYHTLSFLMKQITFGARLPTILENHTYSLSLNTIPIQPNDGPLPLNNYQYSHKRLAVPLIIIPQLATFYSTQIGAPPDSIF